MPTCIRLTAQDEICIRVGECNHGTRYDRARGILHYTVNCTLVKLGQCHAGEDTANPEFEQESQKHMTFPRQLSVYHFSPYFLRPKAAYLACPETITGYQLVKHTEQLNDKKQKDVIG